MTKDKKQAIWYKTLAQAHKEGVNSHLTAYLLYRTEIENPFSQAKEVMKQIKKEINTILD